MKKLLQRLMLLSMLVVSTQQVDAAWYDPIVNTWSRFTNWINTTWQSAYGWWYKTPGATQATVVGAATAYKPYKERTLTYAEKQQQKKLNQEIVTFFTKLQPFISDLKEAVGGQLDWDKLTKNHKEIIIELDSIYENDIPKSILDAAKLLNDPQLSDDLTTAFKFLRPQLRWSDLAAESKLKDLKMPYETFVNVAKYTEDPNYKQWLKSQANKMFPGENPSPQLIYPAGTKNLRWYLTTLRAYKIDHMWNKLKDNASNFENNINQVYTKLQVSAPNVSWLTEEKTFKQYRV